MSERREAILQAAADLFASSGYHTTTVADIAQAAGIAPGTVYLYFENKRAVFAALVDQTLAIFYDALIKARALRDIVHIDQLAARLPDVYRTVLELFVTHRSHTRLMLTEVRGADPEIQAKLARFYLEVTREIEAGIRRGVATGIYRRCVDGALIAQCLVGMMERCAALTMSEGADLDAMARQLAAFELGGLAGYDAAREAATA